MAIVLRAKLADSDTANHQGNRLTAGISAGARTGLASVVTGLLLLGSLFLYPVVEMVGGTVVVPAASLNPAPAAGDDPEAAVWVIQLAFEYRMRFNKDVVVEGATTFWVIPYTIIGATIITLLVLFFVIKFFLRMYIKKAIAGSKR